METMNLELERRKIVRQLLDVGDKNDLNEIDKCFDPETDAAYEAFLKAHIPGIPCGIEALHGVAADFEKELATGKVKGKPWEEFERELLEKYPDLCE
ncbi:MAG: hypothetical protein LBL97_03360 [Prevotellaceae bacterium]|jgi:hypothetical protein|nr:hypothetical protein [Prevotellaceae bacterium]